jgi:hypothetical protein
MEKFQAVGKKYTFDNSVIIKKKEVGQMQMGLHNQIQ